MTKKTLAIAALVTALATGSVFLFVPTAQASSTAQVAMSYPEKHPEIRKAMNQLSRTETTLAHADSDFGGHKEKARQLIHDAIEQLRLALRADKH
jgi:hypothetical protein